MQEQRTDPMENPGELEIPHRIRKSAQRLKEGRKVNRITARDFLGHFGVERRGAVKVEAIRRILDFLDLQTEPDFETVWIDEPIRLRLKDGIPATATRAEAADNGSDNGLPETDVEENVLESTPSAVEQAVEQSESAPTSAEPSASEESEDAESSDPIFRIGSLPAANQRLVAVNRSDLIATAITLMLENQFSQLPVMQGEREVKGVVTWRSIACWQARQSVAPKCGRVADCREDARIVDFEPYLIRCDSHHCRIWVRASSPTRSEDFGHCNCKRFERAVPRTSRAISTSPRNRTPCPTAYRRQNTHK